MLSEPTVDESIEEAWQSLITKGMTAAISGLSQMVEQTISVNSLAANRILVNQAPQLVGGSEVVTTRGIPERLGDCFGAHRHPLRPGDRLPTDRYAPGQP
jgi:hypothetical protein